MKTCMSKGRLLGAVLAALLASALSSLAQSITWSNTVGGLWSASGNWRPNGVPGPTTNVFLTNSAGTSYTVTNDVANSTLGDLTLQNLSSGINSLLLNATGFNPSNVLLGRNSALNLNGFSFVMAGAMTISNAAQLVAPSGNSVIGGGLTRNLGTVLVTNGASLSFTNGLLNLSGGNLVATNFGSINVGGTSRAAAMASGATFTNSAGGNVTLGSSGTTGTLNAGTNGIGFLNQGLISVLRQGTGFISATLFNDVSGTISNSTTPTQNSLLIVDRFPTNLGMLFLSSAANSSLVVSNGDFFNNGNVSLTAGPSGASLATIANGSFVVGESGALLARDRAVLSASLLLNRGLVTLTNTGTSSTIVGLPGIVSNYGTFRIARQVGSTPGFIVFATSNFVNLGTFLAGGNVDGVNSSNVLMKVGFAEGGAAAYALTNGVGGTVAATNGGLVAFNGLQNSGTVLAYSNSVVSVGGPGTSATPFNMRLGTLGFLNEGSVSLQGGIFSASLLTNVSSASLGGYGDIGAVSFTNRVSGTSATTNFVRELVVSPIVNQGLIAPSGTLNAGAITNQGQIVGAGIIRSVNVSNYYVGETLVTTNINTGAAIYNAPGGTVLASGGLLVLTNGFAGNAQAGIVGVTNGGTLQVGDGATAFTNNGLFRVLNGAVLNPSTSSIPLGNGAMEIGVGAAMNLSNNTFLLQNTVTNSGTLSVINSRVTYQAPVVISGRYFSDPSTNVFTTNVTVTASGSMQGSNGDLFVFYKDFVNQSVSNMSFSLWQAAVLFTNGAGTSNHTYNVSGSGSADWGTGFTNFSRVSTNFAIGQLSIAAGNRLTITGQVGGGITNAVYVGWLDIQGLTLSSTDSFLHVSNTLVSALSLPDINLYYDKYDPGNAWLNAWIPDTGYELWGSGAGLLLPIPEPSPLLAVAAGLAILLLRRKRG